MTEDETLDSAGSEPIVPGTVASGSAPAVSSSVVSAKPWPIFFSHLSSPRHRHIHGYKDPLRASKNAIRSVRGTYDHKAGTITEALKKMFKLKDGDPWFAKFEVNWILYFEVPNGQYIIRFDKPIEWMGKHLHVDDESTPRLITCEPTNRCRFCGGKDHDVWGCNDEQDFILSKDSVTGIVTSKNYANSDKTETSPTNKEGRSSKKRKSSSSPILLPSSSSSHCFVFPGYTKSSSRFSSSF